MQIRRVGAGVGCVLSLMSLGFCLAAARPAHLVDTTTSAAPSIYHLQEKNSSHGVAGNLHSVPDSEKVLSKAKTVVFAQRKQSFFLGTSFGGKCRRAALGGGGKPGRALLAGECVDEEGRRWWTSLNLNACIENQGGDLAFRDGGNFDSTCAPCILEAAEGEDDEYAVVLKCNCVNRKRLPQYTSLRMGVQAEKALSVKAVDGVFVCGRHRGTRRPVLG